MNNIRIKFNPFQTKCTIEMNNAPLPAHSSVNNYVNKSILEMASSLLNAISDELNDDFELTVIGPKFEQCFIRDLQNGYADCVSYSTEEYDLAVELRERFEKTKQLATRLDKISSAEYMERIYSELPVEIDATLARKVEEPKEATIIVAKDKNSAKEFINNFAGQLIICVEEKNKVVCLRQKCIWCVNENQISECINAAIERFAIPKYIDTVSKAAKETDDIHTQKKVETQTKIESVLSVKMAEKVIEGDFIKAEIFCDGKLTDGSNVRVESSDVRVVGLQNNQLFAFKAGKAEIRFFKGNEIEAFAKVVVTVEADNLVKAIALTAPDKIKTGNSYKINAVYSPADAVDISSAEWSVENNKIGTISSEGMFKALNAGKTKITVKTVRRSESIEIEVIQNITEITLSAEKLELHIGQKKIVEVDVAGNKALLEEVTAKSSNPRVAEVSKNDMGEWMVTAKGVQTNGTGECTIIFETADGKCKTECKVLVESTMRVSEKKSAFLRNTAIVTLLAFCAQFITKPLGYYCGAGIGAIAIILGVFGIIKTKKDVFWQILLMIISGFIAYGNIEMFLK